MHRGVLLNCWPWAVWLLAAVLLLRWLMSLGGGRLRLVRLRGLHADQGGAVQSLSFVLTLPVFIMVMMLIVQISQVMIAKIVVEYAAIAAARSAIVYIPARTNQGELENCISSYSYDSDQSGVSGGSRYVINPDNGSPKFAKIRLAAILACMPIAPSRAAQQAAQAGGAPLAANFYQAISPASTRNPRIQQRLRNKLGYSTNNTVLRLSFVHKQEEPPLANWQVPADLNEFYFNEVGWQDPLTVTVYHRLALLPGPGRLLFGRAASPDGRIDQVAGRIQQVGNLYTIVLQASATLGNEGEKAVQSNSYHLNNL